MAQYYGRYQLTLTYLNGDLSENKWPINTLSAVVDHGQQLKISGWQWLVLNSFKEFLNEDSF